MAKNKATISTRCRRIGQFAVIFICVSTIGFSLKKIKHETIEVEERTEVIKIKEVEYPFSIMSQDWSDEDMKGFCYYEISNECKAAGGNFPLVAQIYTYIVCKKYNVDYEMVFALIEKESKCNWNAISDDGMSYGYMQISKKWHKDRMERLNCTDLINPYQNVVVGIDYLAEIQKSIQGIPEAIQPYYILAVYDCGQKGAKELWDKHAIKYTYNIEIMQRAKQLKEQKEKQKKVI